jgi:hypothetical protein
MGTAAPQLSVYPNPTTNWEAMDYDLMCVPDRAMIVLRDALGREMLRERIAGHYPTLSVQQLPAGLYLLELWSKGQWVGSERVVVE